MMQSTQEILEQIQRERERRSALTRRELELAYKQLQNSGYDIGLLLTLQADLVGSKQIEYHYELVLEDWKREKAKQSRDRPQYHEQQMPLPDTGRGVFESATKTMRAVSNPKSHAPAIL